jgi:uncharacterized protein YfbU (UPF0304 family)
VGSINHAIQYDKSQSDSFVKNTPLFEYFKKHRHYNWLNKRATMKCVLPKAANIKKAIRKMDVPKVKPSNEFYDLALKYTERHVASVMTADVGLEESTIVKKASPGLTYKKYQIKNKGRALKSPLYIKRLRAMMTPLFENVGKREFLDVDEIKDNKIRTFLVSELDFIMHQKYLYDKQNKRFMEASGRSEFFARYGFCKEYGGFHRFILNIQGCYYIWSSDISGWDRSIPVMDDWYNIRNKFLKCPKFDLKLRDFVTLNTVRSFVVDEDGVVFETCIGNRSGSNNTTTDNCGCHIIIMFYMLIRLFYIKNGVLPTYEQCFAQMVNVMGDDNLSGLDEEFCVPGMKQFIKDTYAEFGLLVKESAFKEVYRENDMSILGFEFLGSTVGYDTRTNRYIPIPRVRKVCSSLLYSSSRLSIDTFCQRLIGLCVLCYAHEKLMEIITDAIGYVVQNSFNELSSSTLLQLNDILVDIHSKDYLVHGFE